MKRLVICRHAKSSWKYDVDDLYRPLNRRGMIQAPQMAETCPYKPDLVICSPAVRAWSTAAFYFEYQGWDYSLLKMAPELHEASYQTLIDELKKVDDSVSTAFIFGHNPGLNDMIDYFDVTRKVNPNLVTSGRVTMELLVQSWTDLKSSCGKIIQWEIPAYLN